MRRKKVYIHYGANKFDPTHPLGGGYCGKPNGLWASPKYSDWGWIQWCENENYKPEGLKKHFKFRLKKGTHILVVRCLNDIVPYLEKKDEYDRYAEMFSLLFECDCTAGKRLNISKLKKDYDGMEVHMSKNWGELHNSEMFYSYDCDSLVLWNLDKVICVR